MGRQGAAAVGRALLVVSVSLMIGATSSAAPQQPAGSFRQVLEHRVLMDAFSLWIRIEWRQDIILGDVST